MTNDGGFWPIPGILSLHLIPFSPFINIKGLFFHSKMYFFFFNSSDIVVIHIFSDLFILKIHSKHPIEQSDYYFKFEEAHVFLSGVEIVDVFPAVISSETEEL